jgi:hypothetical protein
MGNLAGGGRETVNKLAPKVPLRSFREGGEKSLQNHTFHTRDLRMCRAAAVREYRAPRFGATSGTRHELSRSPHRCAVCVKLYLDGAASQPHYSLLRTGPPPRPNSARPCARRPSALGHEPQYSRSAIASPLTTKGDLSESRKFVAGS